MKRESSEEARRESRFIALLVLAGVVGLSFSVGLAGANSFFP
jgi:nitrate/nitrite transporter NarK